jgi:small multidrug resistance pump
MVLAQTVSPRKSWARSTREEKDGSMPYVWLLLAILMEVGAITCMKVSQGFTRILPSIMMVVLYGGCFAFLTLCIKHLDVSVAYAIWSGLGTGAIATIGVLWFKEPLTALRIVGLILVLAGVAALQLSNPAH